MAIGIGQMQIGAADAAVRDAQDKKARMRFRVCDVPNFERLARRDELNRPHCKYSNIENTIPYIATLCKVLFLRVAFLF